MDNLFIIIVAASVGLAVLFIIGFYFVQWAFDMKRQLWHQKQAIILLCAIARRLGEPADDIEKIERELNMQDYK